MNTKLQEDKFYIVSADILPEAIVKTARAKKLLARREVKTVNEAVEKVGLSRSAFYKYKDGVYPVQDAFTGNIVTISMILDHRTGILSRVLNIIANSKSNILTINQGIPLQGVANVSISFETAQMEGSLATLLEVLKSTPGVIEVELVGEA
ncbi:MAG: chorismate mutase [Clostridia bacterium]|jgi:chorismate mutase|nr:chorismate mutase [Clostridia bacterium]